MSPKTVLIALLVGVTLACAAPVAVSGGRLTAADLRAKLLQPASGVVFRTGDDLKGTIEQLSIAFSIPIIIEPDVKGTMEFEASGLSLGQIIGAACDLNNAHYYIHPDGYLVIRTRITKLYPVDFIAAENQVSYSSSTSLSATASGGGNGVNGGIGGFGGQQQQFSPGNTGLTGLTGGGNNGGGGTGAASVNVTGNNDSKFWADLEAGAKGFIRPGDTLTMNKSAGIMLVDAGLRTHAMIEAYWRRVIERVNRGVDIKVTVSEVQFFNNSQLGVDWQAASFRIGEAVRVGSAVSIAGQQAVSGLNAVTQGITSVGNTQLQNPSFTGTIGVGKVNALVTALQQQGTVTVVTNPSVGMMNNRTSVIQVSNDRNFFGVSSDVTINDGGTGGLVGGGNPITRRSYIANQYSFGLILKTTVQIADTGMVTLDLEPVLTDLTGVDTAPDGSRTLPQKNTQKVNTQIQLRSGETYVLGGYTRSNSGDQTRAVPVLGSIPVVGRLFKNEAKTVNRSEILILVTATVREVPTPKPIEVYTPDSARGAFAYNQMNNGTGGYEAREIAPTASAATAAPVTPAVAPATGPSVEIIRLP